jgi:Phage uncharacterised protein (Phage_XkdX)
MSFWALAYQYGWASKEQLKEAVSLNDLSEIEYESITGEPYQAA